MIFHLFAPITCYLALPFIIAIGVTLGIHKEEINIITIYFIELQVYMVAVSLQIIKRRIHK
jgi:ABC-type multidrug transport system permease subunit